MYFVFAGASAFNGDISEWNVSSVSSMNYMFGSYRAFNGDISEWDVSSSSAFVCSLELQRSMAILPNGMSLPSPA
jgi:surface protein